MSGHSQSLGSLEVALSHATRLLPAQPALAAEQAAEILKVVPDHPLAILLLAVARRSCGDSGAALEELQQLCRKQPRWAAAQYELGATLKSVGQAEAAIAALRRAVALNPDMSDAWRALADELSAIGDAEGAGVACGRHIKAATKDARLLVCAAALVENRIPEAEALLREHLKHHPTDVAALRMLAEVAARLRRYPDAQRILEACLELAPGFDAARHNYATVLNRQGKASAALPHVEQLLAKEPLNPGYRNLKGAVLANLGDYVGSAEVYEGVLQEFPQQPQVWMSYGHSLKTTGRLAASIAAYRRAIEMMPTLGEAYWSLANLKTFHFSAAEVLSIRNALARDDLSDEERGQFEFSLGKALEDATSYQESFAHYAQGNALHRKSYPYYAERNSSFVRRSKALFTKEFFASRAGSGVAAQDPIFIVGLPRAGSTLLEQILASHSLVEGTMELPDIPQIVRELADRDNGRDEECGFIQAVAALTSTELRALGERYLEGTRILRKTDAPFFIDKMPNNCLYVGLIHLILPNAAIIDARRHPLGCCFSCFKQHFARGQNFTYGLEDLGRYYRDYVELMAHIDAVLPGRVQRVFYEEMVEDTQVQVRRLLAHCGLSFEEACLKFYENERAVRTASSEQVRQPIFRGAVDHWRHYESSLEPLKAALGPVLRAYPAVPAETDPGFAQAEPPMCRLRMTRGRRRKLLREAAKRGAIIRRGIPLASALLASIPAARADDTASSAGGLQEVVVTAQKQTEKLQDVPVSIQALGSEKLAELHIASIDDYVKYLSGVTTVKGLGQGGTGIGTTHVYMRGVVSGQDGNHSASQPSVGTYIDELPVTTIDGTPDLHVYDIARIEVLEGPQGTLYGGSSEAGTIRIITNKPDPTKFSASYDFTGNSVDHGGQGWSGEGYVNFPLAPTATIRLVGWDEHDAGYIHDVAGTNLTAGIVNGVRIFPTSGLSISNARTLNSQYNTVTTEGGRASLLLNLGDNWTITPQFLGQRQNSHGVFAYDPAVGDLDVVRFGPEGSHDSFTQSALTVEGRFSNFDLVYAGGWFDRNEHTVTDYSDYSYFYDKFFGSGGNWVTQSGYQYLLAHPAAHYGTYPAGSYTEPQEFVITNGHYTNWSHELRLVTPRDLPVKGIVGLFAERQVHEIWVQYAIPGAGGDPFTTNPQGLAPGQGGAPGLTIPGAGGNTIWLTDQERVDRSKAAFGQATWDITKSWSATGGIRFYHYENSLQGFYGYSANYQNLTGFGGSTPFHSGQNICGPPGTQSGSAIPNYQPFHGAPCTDLNQTVADSGRTYRGNLTYKLDPDKLFYFTYSTGFRPGGVNRVYAPQIQQLFPPYKADVLTNWELGWKTQWDNHRLRWNGAVFLENWNNFQFLFLGPNSTTVVQNAASAQIKGLETDLEWAAGSNLLLSAGLTYLHAVTTANYCGPGTGTENNYIPGTTTLITNCPNQTNTYNDHVVVPNGPEAPAGTQLPVAPKVKLNVVARYTFPLGPWQGFGQLSGMYQTSTEPLLRQVDQITVGRMPAYALLDLSVGAVRKGLTLQLAVTNLTDKRAQLTRYVECATTTCGPQPYVIPTQPGTLSIKVGQKF